MGRFAETNIPDHAPSPFFYAKSLARYISDPSTIRARTLEQWGRAPTVDQCRNLRLVHEGARRMDRQRRQNRSSEAPAKALVDDMAFPCGHERSLENTEHRGEQEVCRTCRNAKRAKLAHAVQQEIEAAEARAASAVKPVAVSDMAFAHHVSAQARVLHLAAHIHNVSVADILSGSRFRHLVVTRWAIVCALKSLGWSYPRLAEAVGRKDHTTAIHALKQARKRIKLDDAFAGIVDRLTTIAQASPPKLDAATVLQFVRADVE